MSRIGFIGVGVMGAPIARRLHDAGHSLVVCDASADALAPFGRDGVRVAQRPAVCGAQDIVFVLVLTDEQVGHVITGTDGLMSGIDPSAPPLVVIMSTVLPDTVVEMGRALATCGARLLDAPISGGLDGAQSGTLSLMVGGESADLDRARAVLSVVGDKIAHCGALGAGVTTKILNNLIGVANWLLMAEAMALGARLGLDLDALTSTMERGSGRNIATRNWVSRRALYDAYAHDAPMLEANHAICRKDLSLALALAARIGLALPVTTGLSSVVDRTTWRELQETWAAIGPA